GGAVVDSREAPPTSADSAVGDHDDRGDSTNHRKLAEHNLSLPLASYARRYTRRTCRQWPEISTDDISSIGIRSIISPIGVGIIISSIGIGSIISPIVIWISIVRTPKGSTIDPPNVPTVGSIIVLCIIWLSLPGLRQVTQPC